MKLCTEECRVLGHSDQCWMPPLASPASSDYRSNLYIPGEENPQQPPVPETPQATDTLQRKKSFSTFGKETSGDRVPEGEEAEEAVEDLCGTSLLSEMNSVFQRLLPPSMDTYGECNEVSVEQERPPVVQRTSGGPVGMGSLERRKGHLPGKPNAASYQQGVVAAWAANTHFQNPGHAPGSHMSGLNGPALAASMALGGGGAPVMPHAVGAPLPPPPPPTSKWLPAMEEIPENFEEDEFESVLGHLQGKRADSRSEIMDASELVAEINKLLQDVRQS